MTVSFVNAGLLSLIQSGGIMMGANIGTTITGWVVSLIGLDFKISSVTLIIMAIGVPMMFSKRHRIKNWGEFLIGFSVLFMGLSELKEAVPDLRNNPEIISFLHNFSQPTLLVRCTFVIIGAILTIAVQSSSAAMSLTIVLVTQGLPIEIGAAMILGENIGTTITAEMASSVANVHAKRSARIHSMFNIIGVCWMVIILPQFLELLSWIFYKSDISTYSNAFIMAIFHTSFNILNVSMLIWFMPQLAKIAVKLVPTKEDEDEDFSLEYIRTSFVKTPELYIVEVNKEITRFGNIANKIILNLESLLFEYDEKKFDTLVEKVSKQERNTDNIELALTKYLMEVSKEDISDESRLKIKSLSSISHNLENIGDISQNMAYNLQKRRKKKQFILTDLSSNSEQMLVLIKESASIMLENLNSNPKDIDMRKASNINGKIRALYKELSKEYERIFMKNEKDYNIKNAFLYKDIIEGLYRLQYHVHRVSESLLEGESYDRF
ncbi:sodium-dependent phosphate transporter [Ichthyobacterium seriolicida]|uniref:Sodium-dependent phosphate transporter n=2 Tax=Ichthyobacterium seriolicida TaxID=242600 RepID=A0A1J1E816_9FLAO|nr:sodium-dependent phosphate transporter [Ichthyobacterium seriolicida]